MRLLDVLVLGPFMIGMAMASRPPAPLRVLLGVAGAATIIYNLRNYLRNLDQQ